MYAILASPSEIMPESNGCCPAITLSKVDLPDPLRPTKPTRCPYLMVNEISSNTVCAPKEREISCALIIKHLN